MCADLGQRHFNIDPLLLQSLAMLRQDRQEAVHLRSRVLRRLVHIDQALDFRQGQPKPLATQGQFEAGTVARRIDALAPTRAFALGAEQALIFIKADGARRDIEFAGQLRDRISMDRSGRRWLHVGLLEDESENVEENRG